MSPKTILTSLNDVENIDHLLHTCVGLAKQHDAHLVGVFIIPAIRMITDYYGSNTVLVEIRQDERERFKKTAVKMTEKFEKILSDHDINGKVRVVESQLPEIADCFINETMTADLIVIPAVDKNQSCSVENDFAEKVVLGAGRPILLIPRGKSFEKIGKRVSIAWNLTAEAARAAFDALGLINSEAEVRFVWVDAHLNHHKAGNLPGAEIAECFTRHGLNVFTDSIVSGDDNVGKALVEDAKVNGADLLVMGAYGHSRLRELIFGGATQYVFEHLNIPVLLSR